ncbi:MAG: SAM-dependent methyltransferase [Propionibacteriaceae bacterium]|jgi:SAM-dependent methyltransferase|nr:SAM-dependent methyltransferase [Propionibacteriaceae bacterium]
MDVEVAQWLVTPDAAPWLERAMGEADPTSLGAAERLRRGLDPARAAAVLDQAALRRRARAKLGEWADTFFLTHDGLEMATRADVARWRAARLVDAGVTAVADLGCGLGADARAFVEAGLDVTAVDRDPVTAVLAAANLGRPVECAEVAGEALAARDTAALFLDPSRRTDAGRTWDLAKLSPPWSHIRALLERDPGSTPPVVVKLGPGMAHRDIPAGVAATWVSHHGDLVELTLWGGATVSGPLAVARRPRSVATVPDPVAPSPGRWEAVLLPEGHVVAAGPPTPPPGPLGRFLWEPDPAVIRATATGAVAAQLGAHPVAARLAYLTGDDDATTPFAQRFAIREVLPYDDAAVRAWAKANGVGALEIKTRGLGLDPARWRRRLRLKGRRAATVIVTPSLAGSVTLVVDRG